jgi:hypothetical protein
VKTVLAEGILYRIEALTTACTGNHAARIFFNASAAGGAKRRVPGFASIVAVVFRTPSMSRKSILETELRFGAVMIRDRHAK